MSWEEDLERCIVSARKAKEEGRLKAAKTLGTTAPDRGGELLSAEFSSILNVLSGVYSSELARLDPREQDDFYERIIDRFAERLVQAFRLHRDNWLRLRRAVGDNDEQLTRSNELLLSKYKDATKRIIDRAHEVCGARRWLR